MSFLKRSDEWPANLRNKLNIEKNRRSVQREEVRNFNSRRNDRLRRREEEEKEEEKEETINTADV